MISHPLTNNKVLAYGYVIIWAFIFTLNSFLGYFYGNAPIAELLGGNLIFCLVFAILSLPLWYTVSSCREQRSWSAFMLNHLATAAIFIVVWFSISYNVDVFFFPNGKTASIPVEDHLPFVVLQGIMGYTIVVMAYYLHMYANDLRSKHEKEMQLQRSLKEVEISMLRSQINPHFLFNSLNSISSLTMVDAERAQEMVIKLSDYMRYTVSQEKSVMATLGREIDNIHRYLDIEKTRFGSKLQYKFDIDDDSVEAAIPGMILQPLYENAIKHGVYESTEPILIETRAFMDDDVLIVSIKNNYQIGAPMVAGAGIGLRNIAERLKLIYQNETLLRIKNENQQFEVTLIIPPVKK